jgi:hypothetical protein
MFRPIVSFLLAAFFLANWLPAAPVPSPTATPSASELLNSMGPADLQQALPSIKNTYINPEALNDTELTRATLEGLLARLGRGLVLLPERAAEPAETAIPFYSEILDGHIGYLRLGSFNKTNLQELDANLQTFGAKKVASVIIDLRATPPMNEFAIAADFTKRFVPKGKPLFTLRKSGARQERIFTSNQENAYRGFVIVLVDASTSGAPESLAGVLRFYEKAMVIGQPTAGRAVEYADVPLPSGKIFRVAVAEAVLPGGKALFPDGVKPDLPVAMSEPDKRQIFQASASKGMSPFVFEADRPHLNEAALLAGTNPEIEATESAQQRKNRGAGATPLRDPVLQRAVDLITSIGVYQKQPTD